MKVYAVCYDDGLPYPEDWDIDKLFLDKDKAEAYLAECKANEYDKDGIRFYAHFMCEYEVIE